MKLWGFTSSGVEEILRVYASNKNQLARKTATATTRKRRGGSPGKSAGHRGSGSVETRKYSGVGTQQLHVDHQWLPQRRVSEIESISGESGTNSGYLPRRGSETDSVNSDYHHISRECSINSGHHRRDIGHNSRDDQRNCLLQKIPPHGKSTLC